MKYEFDWITTHGQRIRLDTKLRPRNDNQAREMAQELSESMCSPVYVRRVEYLNQDSLGIELPFLGEVAV